MSCTAALETAGVGGFRPAAGGAHGVAGVRGASHPTTISAGMGGA